MAKFLKSAFADEYNKEFDKQLEVLTTKGFTHIEPRGIDGTFLAKLEDDKVKEVKAKLKAAGIGISAMGSFLGKYDIVEPLAPHLEVAKRIFDISAELEAERVRIFSFYLPDGANRQDYKEEAIERVGKLIELADTYGLTLCHENEARIYGESPECCYELLKTFGGKLKCVFDMGNFVLGGYKPYPEAYELLKPYIEYFHIKDALSTGAIVPPACGEANIPEILLDYIKTADRDTIVTLEPHLQTFEGLSQMKGMEFDNPYVYNTREEAFLDATRRLFEITDRA